MFFEKESGAGQWHRSISGTENIPAAGELNQHMRHDSGFGRAINMNAEGQRQELCLAKICSEYNDTPL